MKESIRCSGMFTCNGRMHDLDVTIDKHLVPKQVGGSILLLRISHGIVKISQWESG